MTRTSMLTLVFWLLIAGGTKPLHAGPETPPDVNELSPAEVIPSSEEPTTEPNRPAPKPTAELSEDAETELTGYDRYRVIAQQNIFSRQRISPKQQAANDAEAQTEKPVVVSLYILRGTAAQGSRKIAFVEDVIAGHSVRASVGTEILTGIIREIHIDHVVFEETSRTRNIRIGETFGQKESDGGLTAGTEPPIAASPAEPNQPTTTTNQDDLLKQMMERRNRELNR
ncbi:MAG: hypothetical protein L0Y36_00495 [Planctomycetales bacterium]|nr:hypothetical protein [Planctomycetales bacterium]